MWGSAVTGLVVALVGILQYHNLGFLGIPSAALPSATFGNRNLAAMYLVCAIPISGFLFLSERRFSALLVSGLSASLMGVFLVYTRTRSAWAGVAGAVLCLSGGLVLRPGLRHPVIEALRLEMNRRKGIIAGGCLILSLLLACLPPRIQELEQRGLPYLTETKAGLGATAASVFEKDVSVSYRLSSWAGSLRMLLDHPFLGVGPGGWVRAFPPYDRGATTTLSTSMGNPHNDYLWIASEYGLIGLGIHVWFLFAGFFCLARMARSSERTERIASLMFGLALLSTMGDAVFNFPREQPQAVMFIYLFFGLAAGTTAEGEVELRPRAAGALLTSLALAVSIGALELSRRQIGFQRHYLRARSTEHYDNRDWPAVLREVQAAVERGIFNPHVLYLKGYALDGLGRHEEAAEAFRQSLALAPNAWYAHDGLGHAYLEQGRLRDALTQFQAALALCPGASEIRPNLGLVHLRLGNPDKAEEIFRTVLRDTPANPESNLNMGSLFRATGQLDSAAVYYLNALRLDPSLHRIRMDLGYVYIRQGRAQEAIEQFEKASRDKPNDPEGHWGLGLALQASGDPQLAREAFREAIAAGPDFGQAYLALGNVAYTTGRYQEALEAYKGFLGHVGGDTAQVHAVTERIRICDEKTRK